MLEIVGTIVLIAFAVFTIAIMGLGIYAIYKMIKEF